MFSLLTLISLYTCIWVFILSICFFNELEIKTELNVCKSHVNLDMFSLNCHLSRLVQTTQLYLSDLFLFSISFVLLFQIDPPRYLRCHIVTLPTCWICKELDHRKSSLKPGFKPLVSYAYCHMVKIYPSVLSTLYSLTSQHWDLYAPNCMHAVDMHWTCPVLIANTSDLYDSKVEL